MLVYIFAGQGSQYKGMGKGLFEEFRELTRIADSVLGYSIEDLCMHNPNGKLNETEYTQPAIFTVNAFTYLKTIKETAQKPDFVLGHSLGEYSALFAAEVFDFKTGLEIVLKRGQIMGGVNNGGMAAVIGLSHKKIVDIIEKQGLKGIDIANVNSPNQVVIAGPKNTLMAIQNVFLEEGAQKYIVLKVSGAFHSRYMEEASKAFGAFLKTTIFNKPAIPVISNTYATPHKEGEIARTLQEQMRKPVQWVESVRFLMKQGAFQPKQMGLGKAMLKLVDEIVSDPACKVVESDCDIWAVCNRTLTLNSNKKSLHFIDGKGKATSSTGEEVLKKVASIGTKLQEVPQGSKAVFILPQGLDYMCSLLACFYAGIAAVPTPVIDAKACEQSLTKVMTIIKDSGAQSIVTTRAFDRCIQEIVRVHPIQVFYMDAMALNAGPVLSPRLVEQKDLAMLLYTSGSTSDPKGVALSYANIFSFAQIGAERFGIDSSSRIVSWMPLYHCFGLIMNVLAPLYAGGEVFVSEPKSFVENPGQWLKNISHYEASHTAAPNFAFDYCVNHIDEAQQEGLSFESLKAIICGGEPVQKLTYEAFMHKFQGFGLKKEVFSPHYGMSEVGCISCKPMGEPLEFLHVDIEQLQRGKSVQISEEKEGKWLTSCGTVEEPTDIVIVCPETGVPVMAGEIGEIWLRSPSLAGEYYNKAAETERAFKAILPGLNTTYFRTGDLGLMRNKQLYVVGRIKEVIIVNGKNHFPNDIEMTVKEAIPTVKGTTVAFSCESKIEDKVIVVQELEPTAGVDHAEVAERIFSAITVKHQLSIDALVFVEQGSVPKTGSGKVSRKSCKDAYVKNEMPVMGVFTQETLRKQKYLSHNKMTLENDKQKEIVDEIISFLSRELDQELNQVEKASAFYKPIVTFGLNSLVLMRLVHRMEEKYQSEITIKDVFDAESINDLAKKIEMMSCSSEEKAQEGEENNASIRNGQIPLTEGQKGLWMLQKTYPLSSGYNVPLGLRIKKGNGQILKKALYHVVSKHPLLQSVVEQHGGELVLQCQPIEKLNYREVMLESQGIADATAYIQNEASKPFVMGNDSLIRVTVIQGKAETLYLLMVIHHIVFDGKSMTVLLRDLFETYKAMCLGTELPERDLNPLLKYYTHQKREKELISGEKGRQLLKYWQEQLAGSLPEFVLPKDYHVNIPGEGEKKILNQLVSEKMRADLKAYVKDHNIHLSTIFLAAYQVLLFVQTGQREHVVGMPVMQRNGKELENAVGYFVNMIPIRNKIETSGDAKDLLETVQHLIIDGLDHSAYPFPAVVRNLGNNERVGGKHPVFQTSFAYQNFYETNDIEKLKCTYENYIGFDIMENIYQEGDFDFMLEINETLTGIALSMKYSSNDYRMSTIQNMMEKYMCIVEGLLNHWKIGDIERMRNDLNNKKASNTIHGFFEEQAQKTPEKIAVIDENSRITYKDLFKQSDKVAMDLQKRGVKRGDAVGLCMERSINWIAGMLGIMKCGAVYLPIDYRYPEERVRYIIDDSQLKHMIVDPFGQRELPSAALSQINTIEIDRILNTELNVVIHESVKKEEILPTDVAYIIYTSGSTGNPKGVVVEHRGMASMKMYCEENRIMEEHDMFTQFCSMSFDASLFEVFGTLLVGATLNILPKACIDDIRLYEKYLTQHQVTGAFVTPAYLAGINPDNVKTVKKIMSGGAIADYGVINRWHDRADYMNFYGPTEDTIVSTAWICRKNDQIPLSGNAPIGKPLASKMVYIVGEDNRILPNNEVGELCVAGIGLARAYLNNPQLTAQKFVDNPFTGEGKMYRTGDLAYKDENGILHFIGRIDTQVKYHGYRIELGEIEEKIKAYEGVLECAVVLHNQGGIERLVAFYVMAESHTKPTRDNLKHFLGAALPGYMIPAFFVAVQQLPLTINGKIDRKELMNHLVEIHHEDRVTTPTKKGEKLLLDIWKKVLQLENVSIQDVFFEIGGDSILAVVLADEISKQLSIEVPVTLIFKYPSIEKFSSYLEATNALENVKEAEEKKEAPQQDGWALNREEYKDDENDDIAIIGISFNIPDAENIQSLWANLERGVESVRRYSEAELMEMGVSKLLIDNPRYMPVKAGIKGAELFDNNFFKLSPKDAKNMGCEARLLLTHAYMAVQDAGYLPETIPDTAVFMSTSHTPVIAKEDRDDYSAQTFAAKGTVSTMISYKLGLTGPSVYLHSNCSSALANLHLACQSIKNDEATYALVGGCCVASNHVGYIYKPGMNHSESGHIKTFDAEADGIVGGDGVVVFLIKKAKEAIKDGDAIYARIKGSAMNNDGADKVGFYAPSVNGQSKVIQKALENANVHPETIEYVEAHGTGTKIGDPIEVEALTEVYKKYTDKKQFCGIGSIKSNIGHLDTAAGLAGCLKVVACMNKKMLPPSINYKTPNPSIRFEESPFYVTNQLMPWNKAHVFRRAAVSSFGIGGTNVHVILEEHVSQKQMDTAPTQGQYMIPVSADNNRLLKENIEKLLGFIESHADSLSLADFAYTMQTGRKSFKERQLFTVKDADELMAQMRTFLNQE